MQSAALAARIVVVMLEAALAVCTFYKYFHATEEHFACRAKWRLALRSIAYTSRGNFHAHNFFNETDFWFEA
jgi:hypothetical protein